MNSEQFLLLSTPENVLKKIIKSMELLDLNDFSFVSKKTKSLADMKSIQFPLLSTPKNVLNEILKSMDMYNLVGFSLLSKKTNSFAEALNVKSMPIDIDVKNDMRIYADNVIPVYSIPNKLVALKPQKPGCKPKILGKEFLEHVLIFFKQTTVRVVFYENLDENFLPIVFYCVPNCEKVHIFNNVPESAQRKILFKYRNATKQFSLYSIPSENCRRELTMRNLDYLRINLTLESLLSAISATLGCPNIDMKILNRFLKLWIRNKSYSRLEYFYTEIWDQVEEKVQTLLAGIDYEEVPEDTIRIFKHSKKAIDGTNAEWLTMTDTVEVRGGYDFKRNDGTRATITVREHNTRMRLEIFIWH